MKKYTSRAVKRLAILTLVSMGMLATGIFLIAVRSSNFGLQIGLTMFGGMMGTVFLLSFFAEKSRWLTIDEHEIVLHRGADLNGKTMFQRTVVRVEEIVSVESSIFKGDGVITKDTWFHKLKLKDGTIIIFPLYAFGKAAEEEILETIRKYT